MKPAAFAVPLVLSLAACGRPDDALAPETRPELFQGPLTIVGKGALGQTVVDQSDGARHKTTWQRPDGGAYIHVLDTVAGTSASWPTNRPSEGLEVRPIPPRPFMRHWGSPGATSPGPACEAAGEVGRIWQSVSPPNFKNPDSRIAEACITSDGIVIVRYSERPPGSQRAVEWKATSVNRGPLPPGAFAVPAPAAHHVAR